MDSLAALVGLILVALGVAGVPEQSAISLIVGAALLLAPTLASFAQR